MHEQAISRYQALAADRQPFLDTARECAKLTLPYLMTEEGQEKGGRLSMPWQSVGAKACNVLSSKLMLSLFPINTSFFKLSINDAELAALPELTPDIRSEIDLSLAKLEKMIMQQISETSDRVHLHTALKHLVVTGNVLIFAGKKALKVYPLDRYVISRDGDGNCVEIITKEMVHRSYLPEEFQQEEPEKDANSPGEDGPKYGVAAGSRPDEAEIYTHAKYSSGQWKWYQEVDGKVVPGTQSSAPKNISPWIPLRFNITNNGEDYGRGRVEEYMPDLISLNSLMQSLVEGSAASAKVVFLVNPSSVTKPQSLARAQSGAVISGRADDVQAVTVGKANDFRTVQEMIRDLTTRISDAFLILNPRSSERTTATELNLQIQELNEQLGGIFGNLSHELLQPYLNRKLHILQRNKNVPTLPKGLVQPIVVAGLNSVGRGQEKQSLIEFLGTLAQTMGPEAIAQYISPTEFIQRLAAASGIDTLNLIKDPATMEAEMQQAQQQQMSQTLMSQAGQLAKSPIAEQFLANGTQPPTGAPEETPEALPEG